MWHTSIDTVSGDRFLDNSIKRATIDDVINTTNSFWKTMHPDYQQIYEMGKVLSKFDDSSDANLILSMLQSVITFYRNNVNRSALSAEQKEEEIKKINLLELQAEQFASVLRILKKPVEKNQLSVYILGYNAHILERNKNN
jgi:hypothetical protein